MTRVLLQLRAFEAAVTLAALYFASTFEPATAFLMGLLYVPVLKAIERWERNLVSGE